MCAKSVHKFDSIRAVFESIEGTKVCFMYGERIRLTLQQPPRYLL